MYIRPGVCKLILDGIFGSPKLYVKIKWWTPISSMVYFFKLSHDIHSVFLRHLNIPSVFLSLSHTSLVYFSVYLTISMVYFQSTSLHPWCILSRPHYIHGVFLSLSHYTHGVFLSLSHYIHGVFFAAYLKIMMYYWRRLFVHMLYSETRLIEHRYNMITWQRTTSTA